MRRYYHYILSSSSFGSALALTMGANVFLASLSLISGTLAARLLGPIGRGELAAIQTIPMLLAMLSTLGVPDALVYYSAREPDKALRWLSSAVCIASLGCLPFVIIGYFLLPLALEAQRSVIIQAAQVYLLWLPISAVFGFTIHPLRGRNELLVWNVLRIVPPLTWIGVLVFHTASSQRDPVGLSQDFLIWYSITGVLTAGFVAIRMRGGWRPSTERMRSLLRFGLPNMLGTLPAVINLRLDQILIAGFLGPKLLGLYVASLAWSNAVVPLVNAIAAVLLPRAAGASSEKRGAVIAQGTWLGLALSVVLAGIAAVLSPVIIPLLFGDAFKPAIPTAIILCLASGVSAFNQVLTAAIQSLERPQYLFIAEGVGVIVTLLLLWLLLPAFQLIGAAITSLLGYMVVSLLLGVFIGRETGPSLLFSNREISALINRFRERIFAQSDDSK
ncbi:MAG: oligosaccharide flippase family protein [Oscillochloridaceae bacterium]|nr:oligosaccharide flippase family protein [Chloroflexaceae bacterium]MDW8388726.1 oligosaccharide flippase family protein [Oscillochloridaceae bacterium]